MKRYTLHLIAILVLSMLPGFAQANAESYTRRLTADEEIYLGPGFDFDYAGDVGEDGVYTIVDEAVCEEGYIWGKLKSGAGWVMLDRIIYDTDYTVPLEYWVPIYEGPGYDYSFVRTVDETGVYTIVAEQIDDEDNYWGKLKSGIGWVDFTYIRTMGNPVITATYADEDLLQKGGYLLYSTDAEYPETVVFRAHEYLQDVYLYELGYDVDTYIPIEELHHFGRFYEDTPFVAELPFYGDMTTYGISFADEYGNDRHFALYISGRNGSLVMEEYVP